MSTIPRYFHLYHDGKRVKELDSEAFMKMHKEDVRRNTKTHTLLRLYPTEMYLQKGRSFMWLSLSQLEEVFNIAET